MPLLTALPLHHDAGGIAHLDPGRARTGSIRAINLLRHDALGAKPASVLEHCRAIPGDVFVEHDSGLGIAQQPRQRRLTVKKRAPPQILAIVLDEVESVKDRGMRGRAAAQLIEPRQAVGGPSTTASPSMVKLLALIRSVADAMAGSRTVQS
jgi:hypothetical protein